MDDAFKDDAACDEGFEDFSGVFSAALGFEPLELSNFDLELSGFDFELSDFDLELSDFDFELSDFDLELSDFDLELSLEEEECFLPSSFGPSFTLAGLLAFFFPSGSLDLEEV